MKQVLFCCLLIFLCLKSFSQLKDVKLIIPKEIAYNYYDFVQFFPDESYFVMCSNALSVYNTETSEVVDEYDLPYGAKNLSISRDGHYILISMNNEILTFTFQDQKLDLFLKIPTADLIKGLANSEYYSSLPVGGCFFTGKPNEIYVSIGSFTVLYNFEKKAIISSHVFPATDYIMSSSLYDKKHEVLLAKSSGTLNAIYSQSLTDLSEIKEVIGKTGTVTKIRVRDSLLICYSSTNYFIVDLDAGNVVHEVRMMTYDYTFYDKKTAILINKRPAISIPDTVHFASDEFIYDIDFMSGTSMLIYATTKGLKFIDLKTKKLFKTEKKILSNIRISPNGKRMAANGYYPYKSLRVYDPREMSLLAERPSLGSTVTSADVSPGKRWMFTNGGSSGFIWDLTNFSKYAEVKDISGSDSSFIYGILFLNDSELVVNSGKSFNHLNISIYNILQKKYKKTIKKNVYAFISGFLNGEFYYSDYKTLTILNLKTHRQETYEGQFALAASNPTQLIQFTNDLIFIPENSAYKIVNRKTKKTEYESKTWATNARVVISPDNKFVYTSGQINKKQTINGTEIDMDVFAIVKIDLLKKQVVTSFAVTYFPYDLMVKDDGKTIGMWYLKHDYTNNPEKETCYTEYDTETGIELLHKTIARTPEVIGSHATSETGKYFALFQPFGNYFKVIDQRGEELIDLSDLKISNPKCFFTEDLNRLMITSGFNSLVTFVDLKNKKVIGQLSNANKDNFFLVTSDLHYLGSKEFVKSMRFKYQSEVYSFEQFDAYLNLPHQVLRTFGCSDSSLIQAYEMAYLKRMKVLGLKPNGKLNFSTQPSFQYVKMREKGNRATFAVSANKGKNNLIKLDIYNNGTLIFSESITPAQANHYETELSFETTSGINRFEFVIKDAEGIESPHLIRLFNNIALVKPDLYLVVVGSEKFKDTRFDLAYAIKDASDLCNMMAGSKSFQAVHIKQLFNQAFTSDSVKSLSNFFSKANINDVVMVFFAGHGYLDKDLNYYFPTYYTDFTDPKINSVAYSSFEALFKNMKPIRKLMFIDACFSGEVDEETTTENKDEKTIKPDTTRSLRFSGKMLAQSTALEMSKAIFSDLRQNSGVTVISSAGGTEEAFEGERWHNGLFTHCLMDGMKNFKADQNLDKKITLSELQKFVSEEVNLLSNGKQTPTYRIENTILDYELW